MPQRMGRGLSLPLVVLKDSVSVCPTLLASGEATWTWLSVYIESLTHLLILSLPSLATQAFWFVVFQLWLQVIFRIGKGSITPELAPQHFSARHWHWMEGRMAARVLRFPSVIYMGPSEVPDSANLPLWPMDQSPAERFYIYVNRTAFPCKAWHSRESGEKGKLALNISKCQALWCKSVYL